MLATGATVQHSDRGTARVVHDVLDRTNHGSQIGFEGPDREQAWAEVFNDPNHTAARHAYAEFLHSSDDDPNKIAARRVRGCRALGAYARARAKEQSEAAQMAA